MRVTHSASPKKKKKKKLAKFAKHLAKRRVPRVREPPPVGLFSYQVNTRTLYRLLSNVTCKERIMYLL
jgi:hypothetical protein